MRVLVVCSAGASSTFLVHRMTRLATERGLDLDIRAVPLDGMGRLSPDLDVVLVGNHLATSFSAILTEADAAGVLAVLLPELAFDDAGAATALDLATRAGAATSGPPDLPVTTAASTAATTAIDSGSSHG
ncbi:MAG: hypothetical protein RI885_1001 [Actinomycetota bacterium]|jgi:PTS system cellobiose-specific IIB component